MSFNRVILFCLAVILISASVSGAQQPNQEDVLYSEAGQLINEKRWDEAIAKLSTIILDDKLYAPAYVDRGYCYQVKGDFDKAIQDQTKAIELAPRTFVTAYLNRAAVFQSKNDLGRALEDLTKVIEMSPETPGAYGRRATVYFDLKQYDKGLEDLDKMRSLGAEPPADLVLALEKAQNDPESVVETGTAEGGVSYYVLSVRAESLIAQGEWDEAIVKYTELIRKEPDFSIAYLQRGTCYVMKNDYDNAIADFTRVIDIAPGTYPEAYTNRGSSLQSKGDLERAMGDYDTAFMMNPNDPQLLQNRASLFYEVKRFDMAREEIVRLRALGVEPPADFLQALENAEKEAVVPSESEEVKAASDGMGISGGSLMPDIDPGLEEVFTYTRVYPPQFSSAAEQTELENKLKNLIWTLESKLAAKPNDQGLLWRMGWAYTMAYNLDWKESRDKTELCFGRLFKLNPEHPQGHLYYGAWLMQTGSESEKSIYHLEKAAGYGADVALMMLGMAYMQQEKNQEALKYFKKFYKKYPDSEQAKVLIDGLEKGEASEYKIIKNQVEAPVK